MGEKPKQMKNKHLLLEDASFSKVASLSLLSNSLPPLYEQFYHSWASSYLLLFFFYSLFSPTRRSLWECTSRTQYPEPNVLINTQDTTYKSSALDFLFARWKGRGVWWCKEGTTLFSLLSLSYFRRHREGSLLRVFCFPGIQHPNTTFKSGRGV